MRNGLHLQVFMTLFEIKWIFISLLIIYNNKSYVGDHRRRGINRGPRRPGPPDQSQQLGAAGQQGRPKQFGAACLQDRPGAAGQLGRGMQHDQQGMICRI